MVEEGQGLLEGGPVTLHGLLLPPASLISLGDTEGHTRSNKPMCR